MYKNLMKILTDKKITMKAYAEFLGVSEKTVQNKAYGKTEFTLGEAVKTCTFICPEWITGFKQLFKVKSATQRRTPESVVADMKARSPPG